MGGEAGEVARARPCGTLQVSLRILFLTQRAAPGNDTMTFAYWEGRSSCSRGMSRVDVWETGECKVDQCDGIKVEV